jgi:hypothetical protein
MKLYEDFMKKSKIPTKRVKTKTKLRDLKFEIPLKGGSGVIIHES